MDQNTLAHYLEDNSSLELTATATTHTDTQAIKQLKPTTTEVFWWLIDHLCNFYSSHCSMCWDGMWLIFLNFFFVHILPNVFSLMSWKNLQKTPDSCVTMFLFTGQWAHVEFKAPMENKSHTTSSVWASFKLCACVCVLYLRRCSCSLSVHTAPPTQPEWRTDIYAVMTQKPHNISAALLLVAACIATLMNNLTEKLIIKKKLRYSEVFLLVPLQKQLLF